MEDYSLDLHDLQTPELFISNRQMDMNEEKDLCPRLTANQSNNLGKGPKELNSEFLASPCRAGKTANLKPLNRCFQLVICINSSQLVKCVSQMKNRSSIGEAKGISLEC